jgi:two-component system NarL family sensor kinase
MAIGIIGLLAIVSLIGAITQYRDSRRRSKIVDHLLEENKRLKNEIIKIEIETQERERREIGQDLHDELGSALLTIKMNLGLVEKQGLFLYDSSEALQELKFSLDGAIEYVKGMSRVISPAFLENFGLSRSVVQMVKRINSSCVAKVDFIESGATVELSKDKQLHIFRMMQEILNNALRHASPWRIVVSFLWGCDSLTVEIKDDGYNYRLSEKHQSAGLGLNNILNRASLIGAEFTNESLSMGNLARIKIPYEKIPQQTGYLSG